MLPVILVAVAWGIATTWRKFEDPLRQPAALAEKLLTAMERDDYAAFVQEGDKNLRRLRREDFAALAAQNSARLKGGHDLFYVSESERRSVRVLKWKIVFKNGSADAQLTLGIRDGEVALFAIR